MAQVLTEKKILAISVVAAAATVIAGILHLFMVPMSISREVDEGILFLVGGILQVFWAVPVIKQWGRVWQIVGIAGTVVFTILWFSTHTHSLFGGASTVHIQEGSTQGNVSQASLQQGTENGEHFTRESRPRGIASIPMIEFVQIAFIGLYATLAMMISKEKRHARNK